MVAPSTNHCARPHHIAAALLASLAFGHSTLATVFNSNNYRIDLSLVLRSVNNHVLTDVQTGGVVNAVPGTTYRIELRYRINDGDLADNTGSRGLAVTDLNVTSNSPVGGSITRAPLSADQGARQELGIAFGAAPQNPDSSAPDNNLSLGLPELGGFRSGIADPFRGGLSSDNSAVNGQVVPGGRRFVLISLAEIGQNSFNGLLPNNNASTTRWTMLAFNFTYQSGEHLISAIPNFDPDTLNAFSFWHGNVVPSTSRQFTPGTIRFIPSAPTASALALLAFSISRRRRRLTIAE